ncbi:MAG: transcription elongation factor GreB [Bdellovibrio sp.]|nr:MAG: transcription elongation factor GreB [Bdellovibrio sp.]
MNEKMNYITPSGFALLRAEYQRLFNDERPRLVETIAWAASNGDRSENADYIYGKRRLREIDSRLRFLADRMDRAEVVDPRTLSGDRVVFGATITISNDQDQTFVYQIVGEDEINVPAGKISWKSPVASSLLGKQVGDEVVVQKPGGEEVLVVEKLEFK